MQVILRTETPSDQQIVEQLVEEAFKNHPYGDHTEHLLVARLRKTDSFIPELSIVATYQGTIVGHILLTKIKIKNTTQSFDSLTLAPLSVHPDFQKKGIGGKLIVHAHQVAKDLGYASAVLLGHKDYYPKFGYKVAQAYGIELPFDAPVESSMVIELVENGLEGVSGIVEYDPAFF